MLDFIVEQGQNQPVPAQEPIYYTIKYTKEVKTIDGETVTVVDENRTETVTKESLAAQKASYLKAIAEVEAKLAEIEKLDK